MFSNIFSKIFLKQTYLEDRDKISIQARGHISFLPGIMKVVRHSPGKVGAENLGFLQLGQTPTCTRTLLHHRHRAREARRTDVNTRLMGLALPRLLPSFVSVLGLSSLHPASVKWTSPIWLKAQILHSSYPLVSWFYERSLKELNI